MASIFLTLSSKCYYDLILANLKYFSFIITTPKMVLSNPRMMMPHWPMVGMGAGAAMTNGAEIKLPLSVAVTKGPPTGPKSKVSSALLVFFD